MNIQPYTEEQFIEHVQQGTDVCLVCGNELKGTWTDYNGQIRCSTCGVTYQILGCHLRQELLDSYGLTKEDIAQQYCDCFRGIPLYKVIYENTGKKLPLGMFVSDRNAPSDFERHTYLMWLRDHKDLVEENYPGEFVWDTIEAYFED